MNQFPEWVFSCLQASYIPNETFNPSLFPKYPILLDQYDLICVGRDKEGIRIYAYIKILASRNNKVLQGPHKVIIYNYTQQKFIKLWITSLTALRKHFFGIYDRLSFERSTYLLHTQQQKLIRLKNIRAFLYLPMEISKDYIYLTKICYVELPQKSKHLCKLGIRTKQQTKRLLQHIVTAYQRDYYDQPISFLLPLVKQDICEILDSMEMNLFITPN